MRLSASDLALLQQRPHQTKLWLSIYKPTTVMSARVNNASIAKGDTVIAYDGAVGSYLNVKANMTLLVGTTAGASDLGKIRIRSITNTQLVVAENANILWANDLYLTVLNYVDVWPVYPKIIQDPADAENVIFYKDNDIAYTDQNDVLGSFPCAGPHRAAFRENGQATLYYSSSGTYNVNGDALTYLWSFEGGTPTGSVLATPGNVTYDTPGHYRTTLVVSNASGGSDTTHRFVSIYDRPDEGPHVPILQWEMRQLDGSRSAGGYTASMKVYQQIDDIQDNALVVIFADDVYGTTTKSLGGNSENNSKIIFVGYILKNSIQYNYRESSAEFSVGSISEIMKLEGGFSVSCESKVTPTTWFEIKNLSVDKSLYHYLRWHSTVLNVCDFQYTGDARQHQYLDTDRESIFDAIDNFLRSAMIGEVVADRQGKLWAEVGASAVHNAKTVLPTTMSIGNQDWMDEPSITENHSNEYSYMEMGGIGYSGPYTGTYAAFMTDVPGITPAYKGKTERTEGLILLGQSSLNDLGGDVYAYKNSRYDVAMKLSGNYRNLDIAPLEQCLLNVKQDDTIRSITFVDENFHPIEMSWVIDSSKDLFYPHVMFHQVTEGTAGETVPIPDAPPDSGVYIPPVIVPPIIFPGISYHPTYTWNVQSPGVGGVMGLYIYWPRRATRIDAVAIGGTSVTFNIEVRTNPLAAGTDMLTADAVADTAGIHVTNVNNNDIVGNCWLYLDISAFSGDVDRLVVTLTT